MDTWTVRQVAKQLACRPADVVALVQARRLAAAEGDPAEPATLRITRDAVVAFLAQPTRYDWCRSYAARVAAARHEQGLPEGVEDPGAVADIADALTRRSRAEQPGCEHQQQQPETPPPSGEPGPCAR
jgi:hypothetical protein